MKLHDNSTESYEQKLFEYYTKKGYDEWMSFDEFKAECVNQETGKEKETT